MSLPLSEGGGNALDDLDTERRVDDAVGVGDELFDAGDDLPDPSPQAAHLRCVEAINAWPLRAVGRRPADYLAHDLLTYHLLRDARLSSFHKLLRDPPPWMLERVADLGKEARRGLQLAALHYLHLRQLDSVLRWAVCDDAWQDGPAVRQWRRLWHCRPYGALYGGPGAPGRCCGLLHLCPWCRARAGVRVWKRLESAVGGRRLLLLRHGTTSHRLEQVRLRRQELQDRAAGGAGGVMIDWLPPAYRNAHLHRTLDDWPRTFRYAMPGKIIDPWDVMQGRGYCKLYVPDPYAVLTASQVRAAGEEVRQHLDHWAERLGVTGGLKVVTVEPEIYHHPRQDVDYRQFRFTGFLLAEAPDPGRDPWPYAALKKYGDAHPYREQRYLTEGVLRARRGSLLVRALAWTPTTLLGAGQWPSYKCNTAGLPLFRSFGSWRDLVGDDKQQRHDPFARLPPRERALAAHNRMRKQKAKAKQEELQELAKPLWAKVLERGCGGRRGRPPSRQRLAELLAGRGIEVSKRQLDALVAALKEVPQP